MSATSVIAGFRRIPSALLIAGLLSAVAATAPMRAATIDITGLTSAGGGIGDSYLYNNQPTTTFGSSDNIEIGTDNSGADVYRGVLLFQLSKILDNNPALAGATITSVELILTTTDATTTAGSFDLHQTGQSFAEASTSWDNRATGLAWGTAGGNLSGAFATTVRATASIADDASAGTQVVFSSDYLTTTAANAITNKTADTYWVITASSESVAGSALFSFGSRDPDNKGVAAPILRITYTPAAIPEPATVAIFAGIAALVLGLAGRRFFGRG